VDAAERPREISGQLRERSVDGVAPSHDDIIETGTDLIRRLAHGCFTHHGTQASADAVPLDRGSNFLGYGKTEPRPCLVAAAAGL
jgi:hypothetical protein